MGNSKRIIITGAPGTGKSSIIQELRDQGNHVFDEVAREVIKKESELGSNHLPWLDLGNFSKKVVSGQIEQFHQNKDLSFYDRGIPDVVAYMTYGNLPLFEELENAIKDFKYFDKVFITPPWSDIYINDPERKESFEDASKIHDYLIEAYTSLKYQIIEIPKVEVNQRVKFIFDNL